jgi:hypothetical protein
MRRKTNFEQVPLERIKKVIEESKQKELTELDPGMGKKNLDPLHQLPLGGIRRRWNGRKA